MAAEKKCFVIMPITVPPGMQDRYGDGPEHFGNVYECLFKPSVEAAGYTPISPKATGSQNIHASIIKNLDTADLVLCDMSCLNPNVFFEWGIRTSLNKPVCVVKDELTTNIPFDVGTLHWEEYSSHLGGWGIQEQCTKLTKHLQATVEKSDAGNELWKHFGLKEAAQVFEPEKGESAQLAYLTMQMEALQQKVDSVIDMETRDVRSSDRLRDVLGIRVEGTREGPDVAGAIEYIKDRFAKRQDLELLRVDQVKPAEIRVAFRGGDPAKNRAVLHKLPYIIRHDFGVEAHLVPLK